MTHCYLFEVLSLLFIWHVWQQPFQRLLLLLLKISFATKEFLTLVLLIASCYMRMIHILPAHFRIIEFISSVSQRFSTVAAVTVAISFSLVSHFHNL